MTVCGIGMYGCKADRNDDLITINTDLATMDVTSGRQARGDSRLASRGVFGVVNTNFRL